jgi:hypothetical protein
VVGYGKTIYTYLQAMSDYLVKRRTAIPGVTGVNV